MTVFSQIRNNLVAISSLSVLDKAVSFILIVSIARYLGPITFGQYAFSVALGTFVVLFSDQGITTYLTRELSKKLEASDRYLSNAISIKLIATVFVYIIFVVIATSIWRNVSILPIVLLTVGNLLLRGLSTTFFAVVRAHQKMQFEAYAGAINRVITAFGGIFVLVLTKNLTYTLIVLVVASVIELIYIALAVRKNFSKFHLEWQFHHQKRMLVASLPFFFMGGLSLLNYRIDSIFLKLIQGDKATGIYNSAYSLILSLIVIREIVGRVLLPYLSQCRASKDCNFDRSYKQPFKLLIILALFMILIGNLFSENVIKLIYGSEFLIASGCLRILVWSLPFMFASYILSITLFAIDAEKQVMKAKLATATLNIILNLILIPKYSYWGASVVTVFSEVLFFAVCYSIAVKKELRLLAIDEWVRMVLPFIGTFVILMFVGTVNPLLIIPFISAVYVGFLFLSGTVSREEMRVLEKLIRS